MKINSQLSQLHLELSIFSALICTVALSFQVSL